ncbi:CsiV family protein [Rheinheimera soli]|uniref:CsiV family protein n=1 Tax=Rheinheimera soli TaxID=443616 RepID=UPI001E2D343F|nr:CsiV family protein [Rheinheimera soli]
MKHLRLTSLGLAFVGLFATTTVFANSWYEIELIAFSRSSNNSLKEQFEAPTAALKTSNAMDLMRPLVQPALADLIKAIPACTPAQADPTLSAPAPAQPVSATVQQQIQQLLTEHQQNKQEQQSLVAEDSLDVQLEPEPVTASLFQLNMQNCQMEQWDLDGQLISRPLSAEELALQLPAPAQIPATFTGDGIAKDTAYLVGPNDLQLKNLAYQLQREAGKQLLLHTAWRQPLVSGRNSRSHWYAGSYHADENTDAGQTVDLMQQVQQQLAAVQQGQSSLQLWFSPWQFDSLVQLRLGRFIQFDGTFYLRQNEDNNQPAQLAIKQSARLTLGQIHYLDHPRLGVIIQVKRFTPPESAVATTL